MGKQKNKRYKLHVSTKEPQLSSTKILGDLPVNVKKDVFSGVDFSQLFEENPKPDDLLSVKSFTSNKSLKSVKAALPKKDKIKLRRELFLKKIDTVNHLKKEQKKNKKKSKVTALNDTKSLLDSLLSLEPLRSVKSQDTTRKQPKRKAVQKSKKYQKSTVKNVKIYKNLLKNSKLTADPFSVISEHLKTFIENDSNTTKKSDKV